MQGNRLVCFPAFFSSNLKNKIMLNNNTIIDQMLNRIEENAVKQELIKQKNEEIRDLRSDIFYLKDKLSAITEAFDEIKELSKRFNEKDALLKPIAD